MRSSQMQHAPDIFCTSRAADDILPNCFRGLITLDLRDGAKSCEDIASLLRKRFREVFLGCFSLRVLLNLKECLRMQACMLANVESVQVESKGADFADYRVDQRSREPETFISREARPQKSQVLQ